LFRKKYGNKISFSQGADRRCIVKGGTAIESEWARLEPVVKDGGFIPGYDHGVPFDIFRDNFVYYLKLLVEMTGRL
jgi:hypothetical protein